MKKLILAIILAVTVPVYAGPARTLRDSRALHFTNTVTTLTAGDATPSVLNRFIVKTANTSSTTITDFDDGSTGQPLWLIIGDGDTTIDFSSTNLKGNGGADYSATENDLWLFVYDGTYWYGSYLGAIITHEQGGLEADVSGYSGLLAISGGSTSEVDALSELNAQIADVTTFVVESTACSNIEGTGLAITAGTLNWTAASTDLSDTAALLYETELDDFSELQTQIGNKTLVNEEDAVGWDALNTFNLGVTITTGDPFTLGTTRWDDGSDKMNGEYIADNTIDNDSIDWADMTDLTTDGAVSWGNLGSGELANGMVVLADIASAAYAKDLVTTSPVTGGTNNILVGAEGDVTVALDFTTAWTWTGNCIANGNLSVGNGTTTAGVLTLLEDDNDGSNFASFMVPALGANTVYTLPPDDGDNGEQLQTNGSGTLTWEAAASSSGGDSFTFTDEDAAPDAAGMLKYDNTVANWDDGALCWYDDDEVKYLVDLATLPTDDDYVVAYDADIDKFYMKVDDDTGGNTAYDDIGDPDAAGSISFDDNETATYAFAQDSAGTCFLIENTDATVSNIVYLLELQHSDDGETKADFFKCTDNNGDVKFNIQEEGNTSIDGFLSVGVDSHHTINVNAVTKEIQFGIHGDDVANEYVSYFDRASDTHSPTMIIARAHGTHAVPTVVADDSMLGQIGMMGWDGVDMAFGARFFARVHGTPGPNDMPTELVMAVAADGASTATEQVTLYDGVFGPITTNDIDLGTSSLQFKDGYFDGTVYTDDLTVGASAAMSEVDMEKLDGITNGTAAASKAVILDASKNIATIGTIGCSTITTSGNPHIDGSDPSIEFDETDGTDWELRVDDTGNSFEIASSIAAVGDNVELEIDEDGDIHVTGDVYVTGDDLFMNTNTDKFILVADGTNFNPVESTGDVIIDNTGAATIQPGSIDQAHFAVDVIGVDEMEDVDHGAVVWSGGVAKVQTILITDNESTDENNVILFAANADEDGNDVGEIESDGTLYYNPNSGTVFTTEFSGGGAGLTAIDGGNITNDTIDNNSIDWADMTDLTTDGAVSWGNIAEGELADAIIVDADIKDNVIQEPALNTTNAAGAGEDNYVLSYNHAGTNFTWIAAGAGDMLKATYDSGVSGGVDMLTTVDSTYASDYVLLTGTAVGTAAPKTDGALTYDATSGTLAATEFSGGGSGLTLASTDLSDTAALLYETELDDLSELTTQIADVSTFITDDIMPDAGTDPTVNAAGELSVDTDGANEANDVTLRTFEGNREMALAQALKTITMSIVSPDEINVWTGRVNPSQPVWFNTSGMAFTITEVYAISDTDNYDFTLFESSSATDMSDDNDTSIIAIQCDADGTECFTDSETGINHIIEHDHAIIFEDTLGSAEGILITISGWFNADVN